MHILPAPKWLAGDTSQGTTPSHCLEDTLRRVQERLNQITDETPANDYFAVAASTLDGGLCVQISDFMNEHPDTALVIVDTFQMVWDGNNSNIPSTVFKSICAREKDADCLIISALRPCCWWFTDGYAKNRRETVLRSIFVQDKGGYQPPPLRRFAMRID